MPSTPIGPRMAALVAVGIMLLAWAAAPRTIADGAGLADLEILAAEDGPLADPYRPQQWHLDRLGLDGTGAVPTGAGQVVAVVDSGVDLDHPDLAHAILRDAAGDVVGWDWIDDDAVPDDEYGHGTMVAGIVAAAVGNGVGGVGVAPDARIMPLRVLDDRGEGPTGSVAAAIDFAVDNGADVVNLSLEAATTIGVDTVPAAIAAIEAAVAQGVVVVASAGNRGEPLSDFAPELGVVVVGATDRDDARARFSDAGRVDLLMAPGVDIVSTWCRPDGAPVCDGETHNQGIADGTSFAAPQVAGLVALLGSAGLTGPEAVARLRATTIDIGEPGPDTGTGRGLVSAATALQGWPGPLDTATLDAVDADQPTEDVIESVSEPSEVIAATPPRPFRVMAWILVATIAMAIAITTRGIVVHRRVRPTGTMPDLGARKGSDHHMRPGVVITPGRGETAGPKDPGRES